jgi:uncharacterized Ntn-hydrolase superfamily protein
MGVTVQGNTLVGEAVVTEALRAFQVDDDLGFNLLPDRLLRALEAGSEAGGDTRCNNDQVTQTAATAVILVARGTDPPYLTKNIGITDEGTPDAPWLAISVTETQFGPNPILELRDRYDTWRKETIPTGPPSSDVFPGLGWLIGLALALITSWALWYRKTKLTK